MIHSTLNLAAFVAVCVVVFAPVCFFIGWALANLKWRSEGHE